MRIGILTILIHLPGCSSLKEKRSRIKPLQERLKQQFNISVAEIGHQDVHQTAQIGIAVINSDARIIDAYLANVLQWIEGYFPDLYIQEQKVEIL